jgi:phosphate transport system permease protein
MKSTDSLCTLNAMIQVKRKVKLWCFYGFCSVAVAVSLCGLVSILWTLLSHSVTTLNWATFSQNMPPPGQSGGLRNAIIGSALMTGMGIVMAAPVGVLIATFLVDSGGKNKFSNSVRFINDVLLSAPSIVVGLFVYFSGLAGAIALAIIALPMIVRSTEDVLYLVSPFLKEAAASMGVPRWRTMVKIIYKVALNGIITGSILACARIAGETAPLLFTALNNQFGSMNMLRPMANLPVVIFQYAMSPYKDWQHLAWAGALIITVSILMLNLFARYLAKEKKS